MSRLHEGFEWDPVKAEVNERKHEIAFADAAHVLYDPDGDIHHVVDYDEAHSEWEDRFITKASDPRNRRRILSIVWTERGGNTRIISARLAKPDERKRYAEIIIRRTNRED